MRAQRGVRIGRWSIAAVLALLGVVVASRDATPREPSHRPDADVPRLDLAEGVSIGTGVKVADIALAGTRLYVLDRAGFRILVVDTASDALMEFGRRGGGPGEFQAPMALALSPGGDTIAVADGRSIHYFDEAGAFRATVRLSFPCNPADINLAWITSGIHVSTSCIAAGADTVNAFVWRMNDDGSLDEVTRTARFSTDGKWGSLYGARSAISESGDSLLFGPGSASCVQAVNSNGAGARRCDLDAEDFRAPPPRSFRSERGGVMSAFLTWPDPLPAYVDRIASGSDLFLVRTYSADSLVVRRIRNGAATDVLVAPLDPIIRCRGDRCYWAVDEIGTTRIVMHRLGP